MEQDFEHIRKSLARNRFAIFALLGFLALITYLLIIVSKQVTDQASITNSSQAYELAVEDPLMPIDPIMGDLPLSCTNYKDYLESMRSNIRKMAKKTSYTIKGNGDIVKGTCDRFLASATPTPGGQTDLMSLPAGEENSLPGGDENSLPAGDENSLPGGDNNSLPGGEGNSLPGGEEGRVNPNADPAAKVSPRIPRQCSELVDLYESMNILENFMKSKCLQCADPITPTPSGGSSINCPSNGAGPYCGNSLPGGEGNSLPGNSLSGSGPQGTGTQSLPGGDNNSIPGGDENIVPGGIDN